MSHLGTTISALIDGELVGAELDRANAHLAGCAACRTEAAQLRQLKRELSALGELDAADAVTRRLLAMTYASGPVTARPLPRQPGRRARRRRGRYVMWSAMSIVVVGVGAAAFGMGGSSAAGNEPQITPQLEVYDMQHAITSGDVPFADPSSTRTQPPARATKRTLVKASPRASAEATRP
ncbi:MAG TPA: cell wall synthesis protein CwsA [Trebonia sp.]|jgi:anti-sigma factor RsiW|nr:cell wall synthesis protein CwsA [Trebonia sp.]